MIEYSLTDNSYRFGKLVLDQNFYVILEDFYNHFISKQF